MTEFDRSHANTGRPFLSPHPGASRTTSQAAMRSVARRRDNAMVHMRWLLIAVALMVTWVPGAVAQDTAAPLPYGYWYASYWNNAELAGVPALQQTELELNHDWDFSSPHPGINADYFSARWWRYAEFSAGTYRFTAVSDDGIRVYVDNRVLIDQWHDHPAQAFYAQLDLTAGQHIIVVEHYEKLGRAVASVSWVPLDFAPVDWRGEYYDNPWLSGAPVLVRQDPMIDFHWGYAAPAPGIPGDGFSARWTRSMSLEPGEYRFTTTTDDGVRLWVNDRLLIDNWRDQPFWPHSATAYLSGQVSVRMEYYEHTEVAGARLTIERVGGEPPPPVGIVVDDGDAGFTKGGAMRYWSSAGGGHAGDFLWTRNNDSLRINYNWARWSPQLLPGRYEVMVYVPANYATTAQARYWISHQGGYTLRLLDQGANGGRWASLGMYQFRGTSQDYVSLADVTFEPWLSKYIAFDAVMWVPR